MVVEVVLVIHLVVEPIKMLVETMMVDIMVVVAEVVDHTELHTQHLSCQVVPQLKLIQ